MKMTGYKEKQETQAKQHFFAASVYDWALSTPERDLPALMKLMEKLGHGYNLFLVPLPHDTPYDINFFQPQVEGAQWLGFFEVKKGKK
jgi:hypothetical protein